MSTQNCRQVLRLSAPVHVVKRTGAAMKCTKMKHERAKRAIVLFFILKYATLWRSWVPCFGVESRFLLFKFMKLARTYYPMPRFSIKGPWNLFKSSTSEEKPESPCWTRQVRRCRRNITRGLLSVNRRRKKFHPCNDIAANRFTFNTSSRKDGSWMIFRGSFKTPHAVSEVRIEAELLLFLPILSS